MLLMLRTRTVQAGDDGFALKILRGCSGPCAEPYIEPRFTFEIVAGEWPKHGMIRCLAHRAPVIECENGLQLKIAMVTFRQ
jgi:hypothetical protein